jgi:anaerobic ribonucleoside-triphosphate reductase
MSEDQFHVHGPHDHEVEHQGLSGDDFASRLAVATAILATVGAIFSFQGGATQNAALLFKNEAAIKKTEASDQWNFYQAKSNKQNLAELGATLTTGETAERYRSEVKRYNDEKKDIMKKAEELEKQGAEANVQSEASMQTHHRWAQATTLIQIAIALAAITLLTRKKWLQWGVFGAAAGGVALAALAAAHI